MRAWSAVGIVVGVAALGIACAKAVSDRREATATSIAALGDDGGCDAGTLDGGPTGTSNAWTALSLPGLYAGDGAAGTADLCQSIVFDPVHPGTMVTGCGNNDGRAIKWYRSTDYGSSWTLQNSTAMSGDPWGFTGDPNPSRDPCTAQTIYSPAGYGSYGAWKSTDNAQTWSRLTGADTAFAPVNPYGKTDLYELTVLPDNPPNHVLATYHYAFKGLTAGGFGESTDGGQTWVIHNPTSNMGTSHYVMAADAATWMVMAQDNNGKNGIWRTTTAGRVNGVISTAAWTQVAHNSNCGSSCPNPDAGLPTNAEHTHGAFTPLYVPNDAGGIWYAPAWRTIVLSVDQGATWTDLFTGSSDHWPSPPNPPFHGSNTSGLTATAQYAYSSYRPSTGVTDKGNARALLTNIGTPSAWFMANYDGGTGTWWTTFAPGMDGHGANPLGMAATCVPDGGCMVFQATDTGVFRMLE